MLSSFFIKTASTNILSLNIHCKTNFIEWVFDSGIPTTKHIEKEDKVTWLVDQKELLMNAQLGKV